MTQRHDVVQRGLPIRDKAWQRRCEHASGRSSRRLLTAGTPHPKGCPWPGGLRRGRGNPAGSRSASQASADAVGDAVLSISLSGHLRLTRVSLWDRTDVHNELVFEDEWLLHPADSGLSLMGNPFTVRRVDPRLPVALCDGGERHAGRGRGALRGGPGAPSGRGPRTPGTREERVHTCARVT